MALTTLEIDRRAAETIPQQDPRDREPRPATGSNEALKRRARASICERHVRGKRGVVTAASCNGGESQEQIGPPTLIGSKTARSMAPPGN